MTRLPAWDHDRYTEALEALGRINEDIARELSDVAGRPYGHRSISSWKYRDVNSAYLVWAIAEVLDVSPLWLLGLSGRRARESRREGL